MFHLPTCCIHSSEYSPLPKSTQSPEPCLEEGGACRTCTYGNTWLPYQGPICGLQSLGRGKQETDWGQELGGSPLVKLWGQGVLRRGRHRTGQSQCGGHSRGLQSGLGRFEPRVPCPGHLGPGTLCITGSRCLRLQH